MEVNKLCEELDDAKAEIERLRNDLKCQKEDYERLRKLHGDQAIQLKEGNGRAEVQAADIADKCEEIHELRAEICKLRSHLIAHESIIKQLNASNERIREDSSDKIMQLEKEKGGILEALDDATLKIENAELTMKTLKEESEGLRKVVNVIQKKCEELERNARSMRSDEDAWTTLENQKIKIEEELKWKKEQFRHLQEAHEKLKMEYDRRGREWERELSTLIDKVCSLEEELLSKARIAEDCQKRLVLSNQALAREETRRKSLQIELTDLKSRFHDAFIEFEDTKLQLENFTSQRDNDIASLATSLSRKEIECREMHYKIAHLERESQTLLESLKETREELIKTSSSRRKKSKFAERSTSGLLDLQEKETLIKSLHSEMDKLRLQQHESDLTLVVVKSMLAEMNRLGSKELEEKEEIIKSLQSEVAICFTEIEQLRRRKEEADFALLLVKSTRKEDNKSATEMSPSKRKKASIAENNERRSEELQRKDAAIKSLQVQMEDCFSEMERINLHKEASDFTVAALKEIYDEMTTENCMHINELNAAKLELAREREEFLRQQEVLENVRRYATELEGELAEKTSSEELLVKEHVLRKQDLDACREKLEFMGENLAKACDSLDEARAETAVALKKATGAEETERTNRMLQKELRICRIRLKESLQHEIHLERRFIVKEKELEAVNKELVAELWKSHSANFESWIWKSIAEKMKTESEEFRMLRKKVESSLIAQIEDGEDAKRESINLKEEMHNLELVWLEKEVEALILKQMCENAREGLEGLRGENKALSDKLNEESEGRGRLRETFVGISNRMFEFVCDEASLLKQIQNILYDTQDGKENQLAFSSPKHHPLTHRRRSPFAHLN